MGSTHLWCKCVAIGNSLENSSSSQSTILRQAAVGCALAHQSRLACAYHMYESMVVHHITAISHYLRSCSYTAIIGVLLLVFTSCTLALLIRRGTWGGSRASCSGGSLNEFTVYHNCRSRSTPRALAGGQAGCHSLTCCS